MARSDLSNINAAASADTFGDLFSKANAAIQVLKTEAVTANASANGGQTTGNAHVNGIFSAVTMATGGIRGGNVQSSAQLNVVSNVAVGNVAILESGRVTVGNSTVNVATNSTAVSAGGNAVLNSTGFGVGNSTVNVAVNSSAVAVGNATHDSAGYRAGNSTVNSVQTQAGFSVGNSSVNSVLNSTAVSVGGAQSVNTTGAYFLVVNAQSYAAGNSTVNVAVNSSTISLSSNLVLNSSGFSVGNSTVNVVANSSSIRISGVDVVLDTDRVKVAVANTLVGASKRLNFVASGGASVSADVDAATGQVNVNISTATSIPAETGGPNTAVLFNDSGLFAGNASFTYNKATQTAYLANALSVGSNVFVLPTGHSIGNSTVNTQINSTDVSTNTATLKAQVSVGSNVVINTSAAGVGNSTVNTVQNSSAFSAGGNAVLNSTGFGVGNSTVNATVNSSAVNLGNALVNSISFGVGNSTVNAYVNSSGIFLSGNGFVNSSALGFGNSTVNVSLSATQLSFGGNALVNSTGFGVGNSTVNAVQNSSALVIGGNAVHNSTGFGVGNSTVNVAVNSSVVIVGGNAVMNATGFGIGNSSVNVVIDSSSIKVGANTINPGSSVTARILARKSAGAGGWEESTLSEVLDLVGSAANGDILIRSAGAWARLPVGSNGQALSITNNLPAWGSGGGVSANGVSSLFANTLTSDFTTSSGSFVDVTGLSFAIGANETWTYEIECYGVSSSSAGRFSVNGPSSPGAFWYRSYGIENGTGTAFGISNTGYDVTLAVPALPSDGIYFRVQGIIRSGASSGTFAARAVRGSVGTTTIKKGTTMRAWRVA